MSSHVSVASVPATPPEPAHSHLPGASPSRINMTPPPSSQVAPSTRSKARTPTPTFSQVSTPPPTVEPISQDGGEWKGTDFVKSLTSDQVATASAEELRAMVTDLQASLQQTKMSAAHHQLQYKMLAQESTAAIERLAVEARMERYENDVIHSAEQAKAASTPIQPAPIPEGMISVQKDLYQQMCREIQLLLDNTHNLEKASLHQQRLISAQEGEIMSLTDKVTLLRDRIREDREQLNRYRRPQIESTPRSAYSTPNRGTHQSQNQPFAALLQASEMASQNMGAKKGHSRNAQSMSSLPNTPSRTQRHQPESYQTPRSGHRSHLSVPATAPQPRTSALRTPNVYAQAMLPMSSRGGHPRAPTSDGTVSASEADDSEAETDIIDPEDSVQESSASQVASRMLRTSQDQLQAKRDSYKGSGMVPPASRGEKAMKQSQLFGAVRKGNVDRDVGGGGGVEVSPKKRKRGGEAVGLGIAGVKN
nr:hypothetical protein CFP56_62848 [Quercus suber]